MSKKAKYPAADKSKQQQPPARKKGTGDTGPTKQRTPAEIAKDAAEENLES